MSYSFPILPVQEILACLAELEIPFTEQDMIKPTPDTARQVYEQLVQLLVGITRYAHSLSVFSLIIFSFNLLIDPPNVVSWLCELSLRIQSITNSLREFALPSMLDALHI